MVLINQARKIYKIHKDFELYKVFMHNFCTKMSRYSHYLHFLQEKSTDFSLRLLTNFGRVVLGHFELHQVFMHNFFVSKSLDILIICMSYKKNQHILIWGFWRIFDSGYQYIFSAKKIIEEKLKKFAGIFELYQVFMYDFQC